VTECSPSKDEQMGYMSWTACDTAVDFCARLRFPRAAAEPPRRFSRRSLLLALQSTARRIWTGETYVHFNKKKTNH